MKKKNKKEKKFIKRDHLENQIEEGKGFLSKAREEIINHRVIYLILGIILAVSAFLRLYRLDKLLGFWYDQGRDALVIWDLIHYGKFFLIGPVTGIEGIFLGPFYYYLLAPLYFLGNGSPVFAAAGLIWLTVGAIFLIYLLGKEVYNREIGLIAAFLYGLSYSLVTFSRWLSNPQPLPFFTLVVLLFLYFFVVKKKDWFLAPAAFFVGLCLQLEAASAVFFLPTILIILLWQYRIFKKIHILGFSLILFLLTLLPQIYFNFRHDGILLTAFKRFLLEEKSFGFSLAEIIKARIILYYDVYFSWLFAEPKELRPVSLGIFIISLIFGLKKLLNDGGKLLAFWFLVPMVGFLFYRGNHGYVWGYYFTGYLPAFVIFFSAGLYFLLKKFKLFSLLVLFYFSFFAFFNLNSLVKFYDMGIGITLGAQLKAIDWIYKNVGKEEFNIDVYVPPQIYYSYSYLFKWYGNQKYKREPQTKLVKNLYTLYEQDYEHPQFLEAWLKRQETIGKILEETEWGGVTVQKRERIKYED